MDFITSLIAGLFDKFKIKNPTVAAIVLLILSIATYTAFKGPFLGIFTLPPWAETAVQWLSTFLTAVTGGEVLVDAKKK